MLNSPPKIRTCLAPEAGNMFHLVVRSARGDGGLDLEARARLRAEDRNRQPQSVAERK